MKQRLAIAATLLRDPALLILDEPANGLDPAGIVEVRELMRSLGAEGRTIFVSSHILSEVQQTADHVAIVAQGQARSRPGPWTRCSRPPAKSGVIVKLADLGAGRRALEAANVPVSEPADALRADVPPDQSGADQPHARRGRAVSSPSSAPTRSTSRPSSSSSPRIKG